MIVGVLLMSACSHSQVAHSEEAVNDFSPHVNSTDRAVIKVQATEIAAESSKSNASLGGSKKMDSQTKLPMPETSMKKTCRYWATISSTVTYGLHMPRVLRRSPLRSSLCSGISDAKSTPSSGPSDLSGKRGEHSDCFSPFLNSIEILSTDIQAGLESFLRGNVLPTGKIYSIRSI